ncbi:MAG: leucine-rich repeat domain-containing protein [Paludibacteraceae bacterium]|nr:leucine-rich repeat domain-containing protein [Paludibacteraceae bacterium]
MKSVKFIILSIALWAVMPQVSAEIYFNYEDPDQEGIYYTLNTVTRTAEVSNVQEHRLTSLYVDIPEQLTNTGMGTFTITSVGEGAFEACNDIKEVFLPNTVTKIGERAFYGCYNMEDLYLPEELTEIPDYMCCKCINLYVELPPTIQKIGRMAFAACMNNLKYLELPASVYSIGAEAFTECDELVAIKMGTMVYIGDYCFARCKKLQMVLLNSFLPPKIEEHTFTGIPANAIIQIPCGAMDGYQAGANWINFMDNVKYKEFNHTITYLPTEHGRIKQAEGPCDRIFAYADAGYVFHKWSDGTTKNPHPLDFTSDVTLGAEFRPVKMRIDLDMIYYKGQLLEGFAADKYEYMFHFPYGTPVENLPQTADFTWDLGDQYQSVEVVQFSPYTVKLILHTGYDFDFYYYLSSWIDAPGYYSVATLSNEPLWGATTGDGTYLQNSTVTISATAEPGYQFYNWNNAITENPYTFTLNDNATFAATFLPDAEETMVSEVSATTAHFEMKTKKWGKKGYWMEFYVDADHKNLFCKMRFYEDGTLAKLIWGPASKNYDPNVDPESAPRRGIRMRAKAAEEDEAPTDEVQLSFDLTDLDASQDYYFTLMSLNDDERVVSAQASSFTTKAAMPTAVEQPVEPLLQPRKILRDGRILIEFNGKTYTLTGQRLQ